MSEQALIDNEIKIDVLGPLDRWRVVLKVLDGTAAGMAWLTVEVVEAFTRSGADDDTNDKLEFRPDLIGKTLCCSNLDDGVWDYEAKRTWDDGFVANAHTRATDLPYYEGGEADGSGTPMGGEIVPDLNGVFFPTPRPDDDRSWLVTRDDGGTLSLTGSEVCAILEATPEMVKILSVTYT